MFKTNILAVSVPSDPSPPQMVAVGCSKDTHTSHPARTPFSSYENQMQTLSYLDGRLPKGSNVVLMGLADGLVLWESMHARTHPSEPAWS